MYRTIPPQVGGAGVIALRGDERVEQLALGAGSVGSSYDAEAFAAVQAFRALSQLTIASGSAIRWFTDRRSCIDTLNGQPRMYGEMMRQLLDQIELMLSREVNVKAIWIPSHLRDPEERCR